MGIKVFLPQSHISTLICARDGNGGRGGGTREREERARLRRRRREQMDRVMRRDGKEDCILRTVYTCRIERGD